MKKEGIVYLKYNESVLKLLVTYDTSVLEEIKKEIIRDCSIIRKVKDKREISFELGDYKGNPHYQNVQRYVVKYPHIDSSYDTDDSTPGEQIVSYDYYEYPNIVSDINYICRGFSGGKGGFGLRLEKEQEYKPIKESLNATMNEIISDSSIDDEERLKRLGELSDLLRMINSGEVVYPECHVSSFNNRILATMSINLLGKIDVSMIDSVMDIFDFKAREENTITDLIVDFDSLDEVLKKYISGALAPLLAEGQSLKKIRDNNDWNK